jgi:hypothetical protein
MSVGPSPIAAGPEYRQYSRHQEHAALHRLRPLLDLPLIALVAVLACVAGVGLLYLLRSAGVGAAGPSFRGALPLEQLARADAQPLVRMAIAWLPVGIAAGVALEVLTRTGRVSRIAVLALVAAAVLVISAAESDRIANDDPFSAWIGNPFSAAGTWASLALLVIGAVVGGLAARAALRVPSGASAE